MADYILPRRDLDSVENIFDIFLLLFTWLKEREGHVLSMGALADERFDAARERVYHTCQRLAEEDEDFADTGKLCAEAKEEISALLLGFEDEAALAGLYGALVGIDGAFPPPPRQPHQPLNRHFNERGHVRFLPGARLPYEDALVRGYPETGTRIENKLDHLTVCFPQRNGYTAEMVRLSDHLLALFDDRASPTFGIVPFRAPADEPAIEVTTCIPGGGAFFTVHATDGQRVDARLRAALDRAREAVIDILVFPELSFTSGLLAELRRGLETRRADFPKLVVAGTLLAPVRQSRRPHLPRLHPPRNVLRARQHAGQLHHRPGHDAKSPAVRHPRLGARGCQRRDDHLLQCAELPTIRAQCPFLRLHADPEPGPTTDWGKHALGRPHAGVLGQPAPERYRRAERVRSIPA